MMNEREKSEEKRDCEEKERVRSLWNVLRYWMGVAR